MKKEKLPVLYREDTRPNKNDFSRIEIFQKSITGTVSSVVGDTKHWCAFIDYYSLYALGDRIFWKKTISRSVTYKDGRLYGNIEPFFKLVCKVFKLDWVSGHNCVRHLINDRKDLWQMVLSGKITNPEKLFKYFSKKYFKGAYSYRSLKTLYECPKIIGNFGITLWDVYYYTTNPELTILNFLKATKDPLNLCEEAYPGSTSWKQTFCDTIRHCRMLNQRIDPKWSIKRLRDVRQQQIRIVNLKKIEAINPEPVAPEYQRVGLSLILDERTCFSEGLNMSNCVHSYWNSIKEGRYLIAKGNINGEHLNIGFRYVGGNIFVDQISNRFNGYFDITKVPHATVEFTEQWLKTYKQELLEIIKGIKTRMKPVVEEDIPW